MNKELKKEWIKALVGGQYKQIRTQLKSEEGHCCLGVLCEVAKIPFDEFGCTTDGENSYAPIERLIGGEKVAGTLWKMNDTEGKTFNEIAEYIKKNL